MENTHLIEDKIHNIIPGEIYSKRKFPLFSAILLPLGIIAIVLEYTTPAITDNPNFSAAALFVGAAFLVAGFTGGIAKNGARHNTLFYAPTKEPLTCEKKYYDLGERTNICELLENGNFTALEKYPKSEISGLLVITYGTKSGEIMIAQAQAYIPHHYIPASEIYIFRKGEHS